MLLWLILGCPWIGTGRLDEVRDGDGDGVFSCAFETPARCDCDDNDPDVGVVAQATWYPDLDGDGFGDLAGARAVGPPGTDEQDDILCRQPDGFVEDSDDCADNDSSINPNQPEICDELGTIDEDCDGYVDDNDDDEPLQTTNCYPDLDGDTYGDQEAQAIRLCDCFAAGFADNNEDCDDLDPLVHPASRWYLDADGDGFGVEPAVVVCSPPAGFALGNGDCDEQDADVNPGLLPTDDIPYDGVDQDCSGGTDLDVDGDGVPDVLNAPATMGAPLVLEKSANQACFGQPIEVFGGGDALQKAITDASPGAYLHIPFQTGTPHYNQVVVSKDLCISADPGVVVQPTLSNAPGISVFGDVTVVVEGMAFDGQTGVQVQQGATQLVMSRTTLQGGAELFGIGTSFDARSADSSVTVVGVQYEQVTGLGKTNGTLVVRGMYVDTLISPSQPALYAIGTLDVVGFHAELVGGIGAIFTNLDWLSEVRIQQLVTGSLLDVGLDVGDDLQLHDLRIQEYSGQGPLMRVASKGSQGSAFISDVHVTAVNAARPTPVIDVNALSSVTVQDLVLRVAGPFGAKVEADTAIVRRIAIGGATTTNLITNADEAVNLTIAGPGACVEGTLGATVVSQSYLTDCTNSGMFFGANTTIYPPVNAYVDLARYDDTSDPALFDLRPHPRSFLKTGNWTHGFVGSELVDAGASLAVGAYVGGELVKELWDADDDGIYDTWEAEFSVDDPDLDPDGDGLSNFQEFGDYDQANPSNWSAITRAQGSFPDVADTDGDGLLDLEDPAVLNPDPDAPLVGTPYY